MSSETTKKISSISKVEQTYCHCNRCVQMCKTAPCIGTIEEMSTLANHPEFSDKVMMTNVRIPQIKEWFKVESINILALEYDEDKQQCCMLDDNNKCKLHDLDLKPSEGKLADCKIENLKDYQLSPLSIILSQWLVVQPTINKLMSKK